MNTRTLINNVLRGMRQFGMLLTSSDTSTTDDYLLMILQFVNEAKYEIEEAGWPWHALRQTVTVTLSAGTSSYTLTTSGQADVDTNDRTRLLYENITGTENFRMSDMSRPQVFETSTSAEYRLTEITLERMERYHLTDSDDTGKPQYFAIWNNGSSISMKVWPTPDATYTVKMRMYVPQAELASTDLTTTLSVPPRAVWTLALFKANEERGSELGRPGSSLWMAYLNAHGSAVAAEQTDADSTVFLTR